MHSLRPESISTLRGLAVVSVFVFHLYPSSFPMGYLGVDLFLLLSGYLIAMSFDRIKMHRADLRSALGHFYAKRLVRVMPSVALLLLVVNCVWLAIFGIWDSALHRESLAALLSAYNLAIWKSVDYNLDLQLGSPLLHLWSISTEVQLYFAFSLIACTVTMLRSVAFVFGVLTLFSTIAIYISAEYVTLQSYFSPSWRLGQFLLGATLFMCGARYFFAAATIICFMVSLFLPEHIWKFTLPIFLVICALALAKSPGAKVTALSTPLRRFGDKSLSYYLWHFPIIYLLSIFLDHNIALTVLSIVATIILAEVNWIAIEKVRDFKSLSLRLPIVIFSCGALVVLSSLSQGGYTEVVNQQAFEDELDPAGITECRGSLAYGVVKPCVFLGSGSADIALIGDSHAFQLVAGFSETQFKSLTVFSYAGCPPIKNFRRMDRTYMNCNEVDSIWSEMIRESGAKFDIVYIAARWPYYFREDIGRIDGKNPSSVAQAGASAELYDAISFIRSEQIVLLNETPELMFAPYQVMYKNLMKASLNLGVSETDWATSRTRTNTPSVDDIIALKGGIRLHRPIFNECDDAVCIIRDLDGNFLFRDRNHLAPAGATALISSIQPL